MIIIIQQFCLCIYCTHYISTAGNWCHVSLLYLHSPLYSAWCSMYSLANMSTLYLAASVRLIALMAFRSGKMYFANFWATITGTEESLSDREDWRRWCPSACVLATFILLLLARQSGIASLNSTWTLFTLSFVYWSTWKTCCCFVSQAHGHVSRASLSHHWVWKS